MSARLLLAAALSLATTGAKAGSTTPAESPSQLATRADSNLRAGELRSPDDRALEFYREAADLAERALERDTDHARAHFLYFAARGRLLIASGPYRNVLALLRLRKHLERSLELDPHDADALAARGAMLMELPGYLGGDKKEGERLLRSAVVANPVGPATRLMFAKALVVNGDLLAAREELELVSYYACRQWRYRVLRDAEDLLLEVDAGIARLEDETAPPDEISMLSSR